LCGPDRDELASEHSVLAQRSEHFGVSQRGNQVMAHGDAANAASLGRREDTLREMVTEGSGESFDVFMCVAVCPLK
jgi:hypothetical protein